MDAFQLISPPCTGQGIELFDLGHHIVAAAAFTLGNGIEAHIIDHRLVNVDGICRDVHPQLLLSFHHRQPELTLHDGFLPRTPQLHHLSGGVAVGQHVGVICLGHRWPPCQYWCPIGTTNTNTPLHRGIGILSGVSYGVGKHKLGSPSRRCLLNTSLALYTKLWFVYISLS